MEGLFFLPPLVPLGSALFPHPGNDGLPPPYMDFHFCHMAECRIVVEVIFAFFKMSVSSDRERKRYRRQRNLTVEFEGTYLVKFRWRPIRMGHPLMKFIYTFGWEGWQTKPTGGSYLVSCLSCYKMRLLISNGKDRLERVRFVFSVYAHDQLSVSPFWNSNWQKVKYGQI